ncbi:hypothetical protein [Maritimibacter sp. DP1N21-5]|uniref:hypothetical protein n=1 Tax=Maritimibacter sp. DP1N21-5 TaxID=2836867 RepID=UPI001C47FBAF|nr:hypothetical protein [Maritimibacter sp. DP1N21-5]MBV7408754.1 hypothetical protein [Maritimibacter sp. DP1N21-5]
MSARPDFEGDEAGRCGACGSRNMKTTILPDSGTLMGRCLECGRVQDVETRDWPESTPCDDCAFRKGSPERADPYRWAQMEEIVREGPAFHCHKGLRRDIDTGAYDMPDRRTGRVTVCAGWLNAHAAHLRKG